MLLPATIAAVVTRKMLERRCPECGNKGVFPPSKIAEIVSCPRCAASIPPKER